MELSLWPLMQTQVLKMLQRRLAAGELMRIRA